jgi:hypothetical protein
VLKVTRENDGAALLLRFAGEITEDVDLAAAIGKLAPETEINCRELYRMNSVGVKA